MSRVKSSSRRAMVDLTDRKPLPRDAGSHLDRDAVSVPPHYGRMWSRFLHWYYHGPDHPAKLRIFRLLERLTGDRRIVSPTKIGFVLALDRADLLQRTIFVE